MTEAFLPGPGVLDGDLYAPLAPPVPVAVDGWDRLAADLKAARLARGMSQGAVSAVVGFRIAEFEQGLKTPSLRQLLAWAGAVGCGVALVAS